MTIPSWRSLAKYIFFTFLLLTLLILSLIPLGLRHAVVYWLEQQNLQADFDYLELSPVRGRLSLHNLSGQNADGRGFALKEVQLGWNWLPLLNQRLELTNIQVTGLRVDIAAVGKADNTQIEVAGINLPNNGDEIEAHSEPVDPGMFWTAVLPEIKLRDFTFCLADKRQVDVDQVALPLCLEWAALELAGSLETVEVPGLQVTLPSDLALAAVRIWEQEAERDWLLIQNTVMHHWQYRQGGIAFELLALDDARLLPVLSADVASHPLLAESPIGLNQLGWQHLALMQISAFTAEIAAEKVSLQGLHVGLIRDEQGRLLAQQTLNELLLGWQNVFAPQSPAVKTEPESEVEIASQPLAIRLGSFEMTDSSFVWLDQQSANPVSEQLTNIQLSLGPVDSSKADQDIVAKLSAAIGEFGKMTGDTRFRPFSEKLNAQGQIALTALDLLPLSPYSEQAISYKIRQGLLNQAVEFTVVEGEIDALAKLQLQKFYLDQLPSQEKSGNEADTGLPIGTALNLLRDDDNNIPLQLPVTGPIGDPSVSPSYILGVVAKKALTQAVLQYYGPFGLVTIAKSALDAATNLRFESLQFKPASSDLSGATIRQLEKLADLLKQRSQLSLVFCAAANYSDWQPKHKPEQVIAVPELAAEQRKPLLDLVKQRHLQAKTWLVEHGVKPEQVITCNPVLDLGSVGPAEMTVSL